MRIVCHQTIFMKYHVIFIIFEKKQQNLKLSSAANIAGALRVKNV